MSKNKMPTLGGAPGLESFAFSSPVDATHVPSHLASAGGLALPTALAAAPSVEAGPTTEFSDRGGDLTNMMQAAVQDLSWLSDFVPDPSRLPKSTNDTIIPELEEAWRHASVQTIVPNQVVYQPPRTSTANALGAADNFRLAMRLAAKGRPLAALLEQISASPASVRKAFEADYGLVGNVYLRASAYPKCNTGKWTKSLPRTAKYLIACDNCAGCIHSQAGHCSVMKKELVTEVPWREAHAHYAPRLASTGHRVATGDLKLSLRAAFLAGPVTVTPTPQHTAKQDPARMLRTPTATPVLADKAARVRAQQWKQVQGSVAKLARQGLITQNDAHRLALSTEAPVKVLAAARALANQPTKSGKYAGQQTARYMPKRAVWGSLDLDLHRAKVARAIHKLVAAGQLLQKDATELLAQKCSTQDLVRSASHRVHRRMLEASTAPTVGAVAPKYVGVGTGAQPAKVAAHRHVATPHGAPEVIARWALQAMSKGLTGDALTAAARAKWAAKDLKQAEGALASVRKAHESVTARKYGGQGVGVRGTVATAPKPVVAARGLNHRVTRWALQEMSKGTTGNALTAAARTKWAAGTLAQTEVALAAARTAHEGAAGHGYVIAAAFASPKGTTGCGAASKMAALRAPPAVLAFGRCNGCVANSGGSCQKYRKVLLAAAPVAKQARIAVIAEANAPQATSNTRGYDANEFNLSFDTGVKMDNVQMGADSIDISFGGFEVDFND